LFFHHDEFFSFWPMKAKGKSPLWSLFQLISSWFWLVNEDWRKSIFKPSINCIKMRNFNVMKSILLLIMINIFTVNNMLHRFIPNLCKIVNS
jgi:hypothetical protein